MPEWSSGSAAQVLGGSKRTTKEWVPFRKRIKGLCSNLGERNMENNKIAGVVEKLGFEDVGSYQADDQ